MIVTATLPIYVNFLVKYWLVDNIRKGRGEPNVYVVIPVYNEQQVIRGVIKEVGRHFSNIICVNDGSQDQSSEQIILAGGATLLEHCVNLGAGAATQTGIDYALLDPDAEYFVTIDADGQHEVDDAVKMIKFLKENNLDIVLGSRFLGTVKNISKVKRTFLRIAALFSKSTSGVELTDPHVGLRVFNRKFAMELKMTMPGFAHASELVHRIGEGKFRYAELPVHVSYSDYSKAKGQSMLNAVNITVDLFHHRISKK
jgi:glycosyltransferase involved in cell wall biosynthesis